jgi:hypothetical protein
MNVWIANNLRLDVMWCWSNVVIQNVYSHCVQTITVTLWKIYCINGQNSIAHHPANVLPKEALRFSHFLQSEQLKCPNLPVTNILWITRKSKERTNLAKLNVDNLHDALEMISASSWIILCGWSSDICGTWCTRGTTRNFWTCYTLMDVCLHIVLALVCLLVDSNTCVQLTSQPHHDLSAPFSVYFSVLLHVAHADPIL